MSDTEPLATKLVFTLEDDAYPLVRLSAAIEGEVTVAARIPATGRESPTREFLCTDTEVSETAVASLHESDRVLDAAARGHDRETCVVEVHVTDAVSRTVSEAGGIVGTASAEAGRAAFDVFVPPGGDPRATAGAVVDAHPSLALGAVRHDPSSTPLRTGPQLQQRLRDRATARQWEVLRLAYERGYFERPRGATQGDVAQALGISQKTVSQHLRAAQRHLLTGLFDDGLLRGTCTEPDD
jgi:hypothetical protein